VSQCVVMCRVCVGVCWSVLWAAREWGAREWAARGGAARGGVGIARRCEVRNWSVGVLQCVAVCWVCVAVCCSVVWAARGWGDIARR